MCGGSDYSDVRLQSKTLLQIDVVSHTSRTRHVGKGELLSPTSSAPGTSCSAVSHPQEQRETAAETISKGQEKEVWGLSQCYKQTLGETPYARKKGKPRHSLLLPLAADLARWLGNLARKKKKRKPTNSPEDSISRHTALSNCSDLGHVPQLAINQPSQTDPFWTTTEYKQMYQCLNCSHRSRAGPGARSMLTKKWARAKFGRHGFRHLVRTTTNICITLLKS